MNKEEIINNNYSICYFCEKSRKPASDENTKIGWIGCTIKVINKFQHEELTLEDIADKFVIEAKEIGEGWVDLRSRPFGEKSGIITNCQLLTKGVINCKLYENIK